MACCLKNDFTPPKLSVSSTSTQILSISSSSTNTLPVQVRRGSIIKVTVYIKNTDTKARTFYVGASIIGEGENTWKDLPGWSETPVINSGEIYAFTFDEYVIPQNAYLGYHGIVVKVWSDRTKTVQLAERWFPKAILVSEQIKAYVSLSLDFESDDESHKSEGYVSISTLTTMNEILSFLSQNEIPATIFVQGACLDNPQSGYEFKNVIRLAVSNGFEIASHSYSHPVDINSLSESEIENEILKTENLLKELTGTTPKGFRAPYFASGERLWNVLAKKGYLYESSVWQDEPIVYAIETPSGRLIQVPWKHQDGDTSYSDLAQSINFAVNYGKTRVIVFHPQNIKRHREEFKQFITFLSSLKSEGKIEVLTNFQLAYTHQLSSAYILHVQSYPITGVEVSYSGDYSGIGTTNFDIGPKNSPFTVTLTAPLTCQGYKFDYWELDGVKMGQNNQITVEVDSGKRERTVVAAYVLETLEPSFQIEISPLSQKVDLGDMVSYTVTVTSINGFSSSITFTYSIDPTLDSDTYLIIIDPKSVNLPANGQVQAKLYIFPNIRAKTGTYTLKIMATGNRLTRTAQASLTISIPNCITISHNQLSYIKANDGYYVGFYLKTELKPTFDTALKSITISVSIDNPAIFIGNGATKITDAPFLDKAIKQKILDVLSFAMFFIVGEAIGTIIELPAEYEALETLDDLNQILEFINEQKEIQATLKEPYDSLSLVIKIPSFVQVSRPGSYITLYILAKSPVPLNDKQIKVDVNAQLVHAYAEDLGSITISASYSIELNNPDWPSKTEALIFIGESPINLLVVDPHGKRVGYDAKTGKIFMEILDATYSGPGSKPQIISIINWAKGAYKLIICGVENGSYDLTVFIMRNATSSTRITKTNYVSKDEIQEISINVSPSGEVEEQLTPSWSHYQFWIIAGAIGTIATLTISIVILKKWKISGITH